MTDNPQSRKIDRHEFNKGRLDQVDGVNPFELAELWMEDAVTNCELEPNAFSLSTIDESLQPSSRIVYLKDLIDFKYIFYTNYNSLKAKNIASNPKVSMLFFYPNSSRQLRIEGVCTQVNKKISDAYFNSRPRESQLGAWASSQSEKLDQSEILERKLKHFDEKFSSEVPRPDFWGGFRVTPETIEFWQSQPDRLHDRFVYVLDDADNWSIERLAP